MKMNLPAQQKPYFETLATARQILLEPFGLDEGKLQQALATVFEHKVDYADLYFQFTRSEGWSLEEGIVKSGSFSIDQGVGVRAVSGEKTAFAYSDEIGLQPLMDAAKATRSIARQGAGKVKVASGVAPSNAGKIARLYGVNDPIGAVSGYRSLTDTKLRREVLGAVADWAVRVLR